MTAELVDKPAAPAGGTTDGASAGDRDPTELIADNLFRLLQTMNRLRSCFAAARGDDDNEWILNNLLHQIAAFGPKRAGALAESVQADPSTVSRQVAALVKSGLIERRADPNDGRASLLAVTEAGVDLHQRHMDRRASHYARILADWSPADRTIFAALLERYLNDFDAYKPVILAEAGTAPGSASREEHT